MKQPFVLTVFIVFLLMLRYLLALVPRTVAAGFPAAAAATAVGLRQWEQAGPRLADQSDCEISDHAFFRAPPLGRQRQRARTATYQRVPASLVKLSPTGENLKTYICIVLISNFLDASEGIWLLWIYIILSHSKTSFTIIVKYVYFIIFYIKEYMIDMICIYCYRDEKDATVQFSPTNSLKR